MELAQHIEGLSARQRAQVFRVLDEGLKNGLGIKAIREEIATIIKLSPRDMQAVRNYRAKLVADGVARPTAQLRADRYAKKLLAKRAAVIARTEVKNFEGDVKREVLRGQKVRWRAYPGCCAECTALDGKLLLMREGTKLPPLHPNCKCRVIRVARVNPAKLMKSARDGDGDGWVDDGKPTMRPANPKKVVPEVVGGGTMQSILQRMGVPDEYPHAEAGKYGEHSPVVLYDEERVGPGDLQNPNLIIRGMKKIVNRRPPKYLFRAISEEEWKGIQKNGYMQSDGRMNLEDYEGTVVSLSDPSFYLPGKTRTQVESGHAYTGRIVRIKYSPDDGWYMDGDGYVKTSAKVPLAAIDMVTEPIITKGGYLVSHKFK